MLPSEHSFGKQEGTDRPKSLAQFPLHRRLCLYPSCGHQLLWAVMKLDADLFVFSDSNRQMNSWSKIESDFRLHHRHIEALEHGHDYVLFRSAGKLGLLFHEDNNLTLKRLHGAGLRVHHFVGICDGCREGGNYECVHERNYLRQLIQVAAPEMVYTTDHSGPLQYAPPSMGGGRYSRKKYAEKTQFRQFPEPAFWAAPRWQLPGDDNPRDACFELQGLLIRRDQPSGALEVLRMQQNPTQLDVLRPFREVANREILAEYHMWIERSPQQ